MEKSPDAFRTISEAAEELDLPQHVLRFWETRFSTIKPLKRGGGRRYYRPEDVLLLKGIRHLLYDQGFTIKGVQRILKEQGARYVIALAEAASEGRIDFDRLRELDDGAAVAELIALKGIGRWTAEVYLMFCDGRRDLFPAGDLALQEGLRMAEGTQVRMGEKALYARAECWRPYRGVAAHLLWAYFAEMKRLARPVAKK